MLVLVTPAGRVGTVAKLAVLAASGAVTCDLLICDEAYQVTLAESPSSPLCGSLPSYWRSRPVATPRAHRRRALRPPIFG